MTQRDAPQPEEHEQASLRLGHAETVQAKQVTVTLGGIGQASAEEIAVNTGGIVAATAGSIEVTRGGVVLAQAEELGVNRGRVVAVSAGQAQLQDATVGLLLARNVHGDVQVLLDRRAVAIAGLAAGLGLGLLHLLSGHRNRSR